MATYYWVGGTGDATLSTNWAAFSGGPGGAGVPTSADDIVIDSNSGVGTIDFGSTACASLTVTSTTSIIAATSKHSIDISANCSIQKAGFCDYNLGQNVYLNFSPSPTPRTMISALTNRFAGIALFDADVNFLFAGALGLVAQIVITFGASKLTLGIYLTVETLSCNDTTQLIFGSTGRVYFNDSIGVGPSCTVTVTNPSVNALYFRPTDAQVGASCSISGNGHSYPRLEMSTTSVASTFPTTSYASLDIGLGGATFYGLSMELGNKVNLRLTLSSNITVTDSMAFTQLAATTTYRQYLISSVATVTRNITVNSATTFGTLSEPVAYRLYVQDINVINPSRRIPAFTSNGCVDGGNNTNWDFGSSGFPILLD